jgi:hypothetical protein
MLLLRSGGLRDMADLWLRLKLYKGIQRIEEMRIGGKEALVRP